jgi:hypothetical protein
MRANVERKAKAQAQTQAQAQASGPLWAIASVLVLAICLVASGIDGNTQQCYESASTSDLRAGLVDCNR